MLIFLCFLVFAFVLLLAIGLYIYYHFDSWSERDGDLRFFVPDYGYAEDECGCGVAVDED